MKQRLRNRGMIVLMLVMVGMGVYLSSPLVLAEEQNDRVPYIYDKTGLRDIFVPLILPTQTSTPFPTATPTNTPLEQVIIPTVTPSPTPVKLPEFRVEAIFWNEYNPVVIIEDLLLEEGEEVLGMTVEKINRTNINIRYYGQLFQVGDEDEEQFKIN